MEKINNQQLVRNVSFDPAFQPQFIQAGPNLYVKDAQIPGMGRNLVPNAQANMLNNRCVTPRDAIPPNVTASVTAAAISTLTPKGKMPNPPLHQDIKFNKLDTDNVSQKSGHQPSQHSAFKPVKRKQEP